MSRESAAPRGGEGGRRARPATAAGDRPPGLCEAGRGEGELTMHAAISAFLDYLRVERNASPHTLRSYEDDLARFCEYLDETKGPGADPTAVDARRLRGYAAGLGGRGYAASTVARRLASLRTFFRYQRRQ